MLASLFQILADSQKAKDALADVEARHQDIIKLEKDLVEIRDLFSDVALLIETQVSLTYTSICLLAG